MKQQTMINIGAVLNTRWVDLRITDTVKKSDGYNLSRTLGNSHLKRILISKSERYTTM